MRFCFLLTISIFFVLSVRPPPSAADDANTFVQILKQALSNNPDIMAAQANLVAARERQPQSQAALRPNVALNITPNHSHTDWRGGDATVNTISAGLALSQVLYNKPALVALEQTTPYIGAFEDDLSAAIQGVFLRVAQAAADLLQAREVAWLAQNNVEIMRRHMTATRARFQVGEITVTDVSQAKSRLASAQAEKVQVDNLSAVAHAQFREVVGLAAPKTLILPEFNQISWTVPLETWLAQQEQRPDLRAIQKRMEIAELAVEMEHAGHWPMLTLTSTASHNWKNDTIDETNQYTLGMRVELPLFTGGMIASKTAEAQAKRNAQAAQVDRVHRQAQKEVEKSYRDLISAQALNTAFGSVVSAAKSARDGIEREFQVGSRTSLDLLDAQHELFSSLTERTKSRYKLLLARFQLLHSVGRLTLDQLSTQENHP